MSSWASVMLPVMMTSRPGSLRRAATSRSGSVMTSEFVHPGSVSVEETTTLRTLSRWAAMPVVSSVCCGQ